MALTFREIAARIRAGTMKLEYAGHVVNDTEKSILANYDEMVEMSQGKNDGKWTKPDFDERMRKFYQHKLDYELVEGDSPLMMGSSYCFGCGESLQWVLTGETLQLRWHWREKAGVEFGEMVNYPVDYVCPYAVPKPIFGKINVTSRLLIANFFRQFEDHPKGSHYSLNSDAGRERVVEYKASVQNVAYGQMGNMSIGIYVNEAKDSIIVGPAYHPAEDENFESDEDYYQAMKVPVFPGYAHKGEICLDVWRWEATDLNTIGLENYAKTKKDHRNRGMVEVDVPHGVWEFEHYYRIQPHPENKHIYSRLSLKKD